MENSMFLIKNLLLIAFSKIIGVQNQLPIRFDTALKSELLLQFVTFCTVLSLFLSLSLSLFSWRERKKDNNIVIQKRTNFNSPFEV